VSTANVKSSHETVAPLRRATPWGKIALGAGATASGRRGGRR